MSSTSTPQPDRDQQLLNLGKQCSHPSCLLVDFLPFKCHHCSESFCQEHFKVDDHKCAKYDEFKHNRIAPNCPLCNTPIAVAPGQDPNVRMDQHLDRECSVVVGKKTTSSTPRCKKPSCNKVLFANIRCDKCRQQFCPAHRFPGDHTCSAGSSTTSNTPASSSPASSSRPTTRPITRPKFASSAKELNSKANAVGSATLGAIKKSASATTAAIASASTSNSNSGSGSGSGPSSRPSLPFNKMDRPSPSSPSSNSTDTTNVHVHSPTTSTTTTVTNDSNNNNNDEPPNVPPPVITSWSFAPPPIFAAA